MGSGKDNQVIYHVRAEHDASTLSRILDFFALNGFVPGDISATVLPDQMQQITVACPDLDLGRARVIQQKIQQIITVQSSQMLRLDQAA